MRLDDIESSQPYDEPCRDVIGRATEIFGRTEVNGVHNDERLMRIMADSLVKSLLSSLSAINLLRGRGPRRFDGSRDGRSCSQPICQMPRSPHVPLFNGENRRRIENMSKMLGRPRPSVLAVSNPIRILANSTSVSHIHSVSTNHYYHSITPRTICQQLLHLQQDHPKFRPMRSTVSFRVLLQ